MCLRHQCCHLLVVVEDSPLYHPLRSLRLFHQLSAIQIMTVDLWVLVCPALTIGDIAFVPAKTESAAQMQAALWRTGLVYASACQDSRATLATWILAAHHQELEPSVKRMTPAIPMLLVWSAKTTLENAKMSASTLSAVQMLCAKLLTTGQAAPAKSHTMAIQMI